jgi:hypothetical protein
MKHILFLLLSMPSIALQAQRADLQFFRPNDRRGINVFETSKADTVGYNGVAVRVGGDFTMQFQMLRQRNSRGDLVQLGSDFNLPTANLNVDVQLLDGVRMHLRTYLSSRHHPEAWVKGGHMQIDKLDFISPGFMEGLMKVTTITVGLDEFDYGDAHFRRSDNARTIFNPFVGNYIMDSFSTEAFGQVTVQSNGLLVVAGVTNGKLNQSVVVNANTDNAPSLYGKLGFDLQLNEDLRVRLTSSVYTNQGATTGTWLYGGDRAGSRYYNVMHTVPDSLGNTQGGDFDGRFNARFAKLTAIQVAPFVKYKGLEFFGIYEVATGSNSITAPIADSEGAFTQIVAELLFRFGAKEQFFAGGRYNTVTGKLVESATEELRIARANAGVGWFISSNVLVKAEYMDQQYLGDAWTGRFAGAGFKGVNFEAAISF